MAGPLQQHRKPTGAAVSPPEADPAVVLLDHVVHDRQSEATVSLPAAGRINALKRLQCPLPLLVRDSLALIPDFDQHMGVVLR